MNFFIEQVALCPRDPAKAIELLSALGMTEWARDLVVARGKVGKAPMTNVAQLAFNYQASRGLGAAAGDVAPKPLEVEVLHYEAGPNWMEDYAPAISHLGMHCSDDELAQWRRKFANLNIKVAQEVYTQSHTNPVIAGQRWYQYVIFDTRMILGVDLKFIVRRAGPGRTAAPFILHAGLRIAAVSRAEGGPP
jgi:hypothetical protein